MLRLKISALALGALLVFSVPSFAAEPLRVVASFSVLGDMVSEIGGDAVSVKTLVGPDSDAHAYQPTPADAKAAAEADLIVVNGLNLEGGMRGMLAQGTKAKLVVASLGVKPRMMTEEQGEVVDPHAWQDLRNGELYARNIASALIAAAPDKAEAIKARTKDFIQRCEAMDRDVRAQMAAVPEARRKVITSHDAFGYFGAAYGVTFLAPLGLSTESEAGAQNVAALIKQIRAEGVKTVFIENMTDPRLIKQIAKDSGAKLGGELYSDALSPADGPAPHYLDMFKNNVGKMVKAMGE